MLILAPKLFNTGAISFNFSGEALFDILLLAIIDYSRSAVRGTCPECVTKELHSLNDHWFPT